MKALKALGCSTRYALQDGPASQQWQTSGNKIRKFTSNIDFQNAFIDHLEVTMLTQQNSGSRSYPPWLPWVGASAAERRVVSCHEV